MINNNSWYTACTMGKATSVFICQECGGENSKWAGQCPRCGAWNSLVEQVVSKASKTKFKAKKCEAKPVFLSQIQDVLESRIKTGIGELDRVLGGGIVPGSVVLVAGEPGIGKSTLLTQLALRVGQGTTTQQSGSSYFARSMRGGKAGDKNVSASLNSRKSNASSVLYVCGEESPSQIKMRIDRIAAKGKKEITSDGLMFLPDTDVDIAIATIESKKPVLVIVDSIQMMHTDDLRSVTGSVSQISQCTNRLIETAKKTNAAVFIVGHVTKEGAIAGPKILEHLVDAVLELNGDRQHEYRIVRANKNRFGPTDEVGIFAMDDVGMSEVKNPSDRFLEERQNRIPGSVVVCVLEGTRPMLVEIQALVVPSGLSIPRRVANGVDQRRVQLLTAVLTKRCGIKLAEADVYVNVAGGLAVREPAVDFGICLAIASSAYDRALPKGTVVIGEVGLLGEVRKVNRLSKRINEARAQGFKMIISPEEYSSLVNAIQKLLK
jgi:DNA repair protein RadA/Sms